MHTLIRCAAIILVILSAMPLPAQTPPSQTARDAINNGPIGDYAP